jgi:hypothetical protein
VHPCLRSLPTDVPTVPAYYWCPSVPVIAPVHCPFTLYMATTQYESWEHVSDQQL